MRSAPVTREKHAEAQALADAIRAATAADTTVSPACRAVRPWGNCWPDIGEGGASGAN